MTRPIRIVIAADSFKGSLTSMEAGTAISVGLQAGLAEKGIASAFAVVPIADGGEGTIEAFTAARGGERAAVSCPGPLGDPVEAEFLLLPGGTTAVIESAQSCGLGLVAGRADILRSNTAGLGRQIAAALDRRPTRILVGLGGSATNDWGAGMADALGARFLGGGGRPLPPCPAALGDVRSIDLSRWDARLLSVRFEAVSDVDNPLLGPEGAAAVFSPQKGADPRTVQILQKTGSRFADVVEAAAGRRFRDHPGAGAAGGLGFGLMAFLNAEIRSGIETIIEAADLRNRIEDADLIITGEGCLDAQSRRGKTAAGIARLARDAGRPCIIFSGSINGPVSAFVPDMFAAAYEIRTAAGSLDEAVAKAALYLEQAARRAAPEIAALAVKPGSPAR